MADFKRQSHVIRVYEKNDDGTEDRRGSWLDLEIIDQIAFETGSGFTWQRTIIKLYYSDPPDDPTSLNPTRVFTPLKVKSPDESTWVEIPICTSLVIEEGQGFSWQRTVITFVNTEENVGRIVTTKRVIHNEVNDEDDNGQPPPKPEDYIQSILDAAEQDKHQYVDVAVPSAWRTTEGSGFSWQGTVFTLNDEDPLMQDPLVPPPD